MTDRSIRVAHEGSREAWLVDTFTPWVEQWFAMAGSHDSAEQISVLTIHIGRIIARDVPTAERAAMLTDIAALLRLQIDIAEMDIVCGAPRGQA